MATNYDGVGFYSDSSVRGKFSQTFTHPGVHYYIAEGLADIGMLTIATLAALSYFLCFMNSHIILRDYMCPYLFSFLCVTMPTDTLQEEGHTSLITRALLSCI